MVILFLWQMILTGDGVNNDGDDKETSQILSISHFCIKWKCSLT